MVSSHPSVSAMVVCFNEEDRIEECLKSLRWCDEIVVVDSFSTDRTPEICRHYTDRFVQHEWTGYREQKAFAQKQTTKEWVLVVDSDERVSTELQAEIRDALSRHGQEYAGFSLPRLVYYLDRWWWRGGWYPDYDVRLFRRDRGVLGGTDPHDKVLVNGKIYRLQNPLHHYSYRNIDDHIQRINRYTTISSRELQKDHCRWRLSDALLRPAVRFFRNYFLKRGFMEGFAGFYVALTAAVYVFLKYAKLWELELEEKKQIERER
ncbi:MAG TPA: glycosyltransferase family 2 protein [Acidobacteriota bacterium]|nr:glycosyltransferase family 2 protein [Acidobacteriota bacterium]